MKKRFAILLLAVSLLLALSWPASAQDAVGTVTMTADGDRAAVTLSLPAQEVDGITSLRLSFEVQTDDAATVEFVFDEGLQSSVQQARYNASAGRLTIYLSGRQAMFTEGAVSLGEIRLSASQDLTATVQVQEDSLRLANGAYGATDDLELISQPVTLSVTGTDVPSGGDQGSGDQGSGDQGSGDQGSGDQGSGDQGSGDQGSGDQGSGDQGSGNQGSGDQGSGSQGSGNQGSGSQGSTNQSTGNQSSGSQTSQQSASGQNTSGQNTTSGGNDETNEPTVLISPNPEAEAEDDAADTGEGNGSHPQDQATASDEENQQEQSQEQTKSGLSRRTIALIAVGGVVVVAAVIALLLLGKRR